MSIEHKSKLITGIPIEIGAAQGVLSLKQFTQADASDIFALICANRAHLSQHDDDTAGKYPNLASVEASIQPVAQATKLRFAIRDESGAYVGTVNLSPLENEPDQMEIGYYIGQEYGRKGYATEAVGMLCDWAFTVYGLSRIVANTHPENTASQRVLAKAGFVRLAEPGEYGNVVFEKIRSESPILD